MRELILASASPRRRALLAGLGLSFRVVPSAASEEVENGRAPGALVQELARRKAAAVAGKLSEREGRLVIGADTIVVLEGRILGKPQDEAEAQAMLRALSGRWHEVFTGVAVIDPAAGKTVSAHRRTRVKFRSLSAGEIAAYAATGEPLDKAGAYGVQGKGALLVERIEGCFYNVVGLPLVTLAALLGEFGVDIWEEAKKAGRGVSPDVKGAAAGQPAARTSGGARR